MYDKARISFKQRKVDIMRTVNEKHMKCPYENECKSKYGYCHRWKVEDTTLVDGKLITTRIIYDCNKSLIKV